MQDQGAPAQTSPPPPRTSRDSIDAIARMEEDFLQSRNFRDRTADLVTAGVGTLVSVMVHLGLLCLWVLWNSRVIPGAHAFDPYPFVLLAMLLSMEGVLLAIFILTKQNRMSRWSDHRAHLHLQIALLSEKEITRVLQMLTTISGRLGVDTGTDDEVKELSQTTAVDSLAEELHKKLPS